MSGYVDGPRFRAQLVAHVGDGTSLVRIALIKGIKVTYSEIEIPTEQIPADLREIGSQFLVLLNTALPKDTDLTGDFRANYRLFQVSRLPETD